VDTLTFPNVTVDLTEQRIVIVGAGLGGLRVAEGLRQAGHRGPIVLLGAESELPYDRPPLSKQVLRGEKELVYLREEYDSLGLDFRRGVSAQSLDVAGHRVTLDDGSVLEYDAVVIATGAVPRVLPETEGYENVHVLRTANDAYVLREELTRAKHLTIVGGGFIGCEVAASARAMGVEVTIVEILTRPLIRVLGDAVSQLVSDIHVDHGVDIHGATSIATFHGEGRLTGVTLTDGTEIKTDVLLAGLGVTPDVGWLEGSGLEIDNGVICDEFCQAAPGVWAVGDVARWRHVGLDELRRLEHWTNAADMASAVAMNIVAPDGERQPYLPVPYVWSDQYDVKIQSVGFFRESDDVTLLKVGPKQKQVAIYGRDGKLTGAVGFSAPAPVMRLRQLLVDGGSVQEAIDRVSG